MNVVYSLIAYLSHTSVYLLFICKPITLRSKVNRMKEIETKLRVGFQKSSRKKETNQQKKKKYLMRFNPRRWYVWRAWHVDDLISATSNTSFYWSYLAWPYSFISLLFSAFVALTHRLLFVCVCSCVCAHDCCGCNHSLRAANCHWKCGCCAAAAAAMNWAVPSKTGLRFL